MEVRGEARRLADAFAEGEVEKASQRLRSAADSHRHTLRTLETFHHENQELSKLVQELPTKVSYPIMVPFGKAAFFAGKLVHTNEFLVLLGEGYYAECSACKTLEILSRRSNLLSSQIAGVKSQLADLDVESRFFNETLAEAAAGVVEIREEFVEPLVSGSASNLEMGNFEHRYCEGSSLTSTIKEESAKGKEVGLTDADKGHESSMLLGKEVGSTDDDKEHERIMARLDEIEAAEAAAEMNINVQDVTGSSTELQPPDQEHGYLSTDFWHDESLDKEVRAANFTAARHMQEIVNIDRNRAEESAKLCRDGGRLQEEGHPMIQSPGDLLKFEEWRRSESKKGNSYERTSELKHDHSMPSPPEHKVQEPCVQDHVDGFRPTPSGVVSALQTEQQRSLRASTNKAFTGSVVERTGPIPLTDPSKTEKRVQQRQASKFKMRQQADK